MSLLSLVLDLIDLVLHWEIYRWVLPAGLVVLGLVGFLAGWAIWFNVAALLAGLAWLGFNVWKGPSEAEW